MSGWQGGSYFGPMSDPGGIVTYVDLAQWAQTTLTEAENRFGRLDGPERMRIAGADYFWVRDILEAVAPTDEWDGKCEVMRNVERAG